MKHILTCSFGKDSIATALLALQHGEPLDELVYSEVMFSDTVSGELPEHKRFIYETAIPYFEKRGIPTRVLRGQKTYLDCFYRIVSRGNAEGKLASFPLTGRCSIQRDCKLPPIRTYQKTLPPDTVYYLGIAADEPIRLARLKENQISLLAKYALTEKDAWAMCQAEGLLSPLYAFTGRGGCWFCPNASMNNRLICFNIQSLGDQLRPIAMMSLLEFINMQVMTNRRKDATAATWIYFDEIHVLLKDPMSSNFLYSSWKRFRKYNAYATGISQDIQDYLDNPVAYALLSNSEFVIMLRQSKSLEALERLYGLSKPQMEFLRNASEGHGIIKMGNSMIPFSNLEPKDTAVYKLITTKPGEATAEK